MLESYCPEMKAEIDKANTLTFVVLERQIKIFQVSFMIRDKVDTKFDIKVNNFMKIPYLKKLAVEKLKDLGNIPEKDL